MVRRWYLGLINFNEKTHCIDRIEFIVLVAEFAIDRHASFIIKNAADLITAKRYQQRFDT